MDSELERYHKSCAALELSVGEGRSKHAALQKELTRQHAQTQDAHQAIRYTSSSVTAKLAMLSVHEQYISTLRAVLGRHEILSLLCCVVLWSCCSSL